MANGAGASLGHVRAIPVLICIDVEPDDFFIDHDRAPPWRGYESAIEMFGQVRAETEAADSRAMHFTWVFRMDHQVEEVYGRADWAIQRYPQFLEEITARGDEVGLHAHAYRWDAAATRWISDHGNQPWIERCLEISFDAFERAFARPCVTFRFGDRWMNHQTFQQLERRGIRYDLTVEPGQPEVAAYHPNEVFTGSLPDYSTVPRSPYRPDREEFRRADARRREGVWVVPMTTAPVRGRWLRDAYQRAFHPTRAGGMRTALLSHEPLLFARIIAHALAQPDIVHLALPVRSNALAAPRLARRVRANLDMLRRHPLAERFVWATPAELVALTGE